MRATLGLAALAVCASALEGAVLRPIAVEEFFVTPGKPAVLRWRIEPEKFAAPLDYAVRDYWGKTVAAGRAEVVGEKTAQVAVQLAPGFYDIEFPAAKERFGLIALPASEGKPDPFFAIDSALSWLVGSDAVREALVKGLARTGIRMSRERVSWGQINPKKDAWEWETSRRYDALRRSYAEHGVAVLEMFHDSPAWPGKVAKYPDDLAATARSWQAIARRWRPTWGAFEVWNEPDIFFGGHLPADQYASLVKAFSWAFAEAGIDVPLVGGVLAHYNSRYVENMARNGLLDCVDVASFHTYGRALQMEGLVARFRAWLKAHGKETMPLWLTECGRPWKRGPGRPPADQGRESALDITMKAVEARACGIAVHFPFVYPYYEERENNFGMMGKRGTALRSMAAYAQMVRALAHTRYLGDLVCDDKIVQRARVFGDERQTVVVLYTAQVEAKRVVSLGVPTLRAEGIDGRSLEIAQDGAVRVPDGLTYVWLDRTRLGDRLKTDTGAMRLYAVAAKAPPTRPKPSPIVLRFQHDAEAVSHKPEGYRIKAVPAGRQRLRVRVFNLSDGPRELALRLDVAGAALAVQRVILPARDAADVLYTVDLSDAFAAADVVTATVTAGDGIPPLSVDLFGEARIEQVKERYKKPVRLPIGDVASWRANITPDGKMTMARTKEGGWRLEATFAQGDPWAYPFFRLPKGIDLRRGTALVLKARCKGRAAVRIFLWEGESGVGYLSPEGIIPADGAWHTATVRFDGLHVSTANRPDGNARLDLGKVRKISIGLNSEAKSNVLEVAEAYVVGE